MANFDEDDLVLYVFGEAAPEIARQIEEEMSRDPELRAKLNLMGATVESVSPNAAAAAAAGSVTAGKPRSGSSWRKGAIAASILAGIVGIGWAGWTIVNAPLLHDNFDDGWFDQTLWRNPPEIAALGGIREEGGYLRQVNRGYLVTKKEFPGPISVSFDWKCVDLGFNPNYADRLTVALRTTGQPENWHAYEVADGIMVVFNVTAGVVSVSRAGGRDGPNYGRTDREAVRFAADQWNHIEVTDDGKTIRVYVQGPANTQKDWTKPVLSAECPYTGKAHHIAIYNRELLAKIPHESYLDNIVIRRLARP